MAQETNTPTEAQLRDARRQGFAHSTSYLPEERRDRIRASYIPQDDRREKNIGGFVSQVRAGLG